jgi:hypothetical protein
MLTQAAPLKTTCFYIGVFSSEVSLDEVFAVLKSQGTVLRMKFSRDKSDESLKPFGYALMEHSVPEGELFDVFIRAQPPVLVRPIPGPRYIGAEHVQLMKRYVICTPIKDMKLSRDIIRKSLAAHAHDVMFDITEFHQHLLHPVRKIHLLFKDVSSVERYCRHYNRTNDSRLYSLTRVKDHQASRFQTIKSPFEVSTYSIEPSDSHFESAFNRRPSPTTSLERTGLSEPVQGMNSRAIEASANKTYQKSLPRNHKASQLSEWTLSFVFKPAMNFKSKKLHCTINNSQLERQSSSIIQNHSTCNLRFNVILAK